MTVCDYCLEEAFDMGASDIQEAVGAMQELGDDLPDHLCDEIEQAGLTRCACACKGDSKKRIRQGVTL
jgi:hypothetical protein